LARLDTLKEDLEKMIGIDWSDAIDRARCTVGVTSSPCGFQTFFQNGWEFLYIFTHLLCVHIYARLQVQIINQLSLTLTTLCHTKREHPSNFFCISLELNF